MKPSMRHSAMELTNASDDEYIDMEIRSPQLSRDFEFPMGSAPLDRTETESPADELFYKGNLLPLHLPPRLQMVQRLRSPEAKELLHRHRGMEEVGFDEEEEKGQYDGSEDDDTYSLSGVLIMPSASTAPSTSTSTPLITSCNISSSESCRVSCELRPDDDECFFEWSNDLRGFIHQQQDEKKRSSNAGKCSSVPSSAVLWSKKLKQIKQSLLCQKLKASKAYLRSLFTKSGDGGRDGVCSGASITGMPGNVGSGSGLIEGFRKLQKPVLSEQTDARRERCNYRYKSLSSSVMKRIDRELAERGAISSHRKSFSSVIQQHSSANKPSSSSSSSSSFSSSSSSSSSGSCSFSFKLNGGAICEFQLLKRSSSANLDLESSIAGAIAHCKK